MSELAEGCGTLCGPSSIEQIANAIERVVMNKALRREFAEKGLNESEAVFVE